MSNLDPLTDTSTNGQTGIQEIHRVLIVGAGTMGREIAAQCARHGVRAILYDSSPSVLEEAAAHLQRSTRQLERGHAEIETRADLRVAGEADLVIECVPENLELKRRVLGQLGEHCRPETILATNTSSLVPSQLAASYRFPQKLAALHFHLPVAICTIVDLMPHPGTEPGVVQSLNAFARKIGQLPMPYEREYHGYIFNSIFGAMQRQALDLVIQGVATVENVDRSWMGIFKTRVGPFGMFDGIGLNNLVDILGHWAETQDDNAGRKRVAFLRQWTNQGFLGVRTNRGFYTYPEPAYARPDFLT